MLKILVPFLIISSVWSGVGGIAGGNTSFQKGTHIHFQRASTWVNVLYSKSLCHDGHDFESLVKKCVEWNESNNEKSCSKYIKVKAYQPIDGFKERCKKTDDGDCIAWETVRYFQSPKKVVEIRNNDDEVLKTKKVVIPTCK